MERLVKRLLRLPHVIKSPLRRESPEITATKVISNFLALPGYSDKMEEIGQVIGGRDV